MLQTEKQQFNFADGATAPARAAGVTPAEAQTNNDYLLQTWFDDAQGVGLYRYSAFDRAYNKR